MDYLYHVLGSIANVVYTISNMYFVVVVVVVPSYWKDRYSGECN